MRVRPAMVGLLLVAAAGSACRRMPQANRFTPPEATAKKALEAALGAWRAGAPATDLDIGGRHARLADAQQAAGGRLAGFEVLSSALADAGRRYTVRLELEAPAAVQQANYVVIGIDPVWVIRQEDLEMVTHWDHPMDAEPPNPANETR